MIDSIISRNFYVLQCMTDSLADSYCYCFVAAIVVVQILLDFSHRICYRSCDLHITSNERGEEAEKKKKNRVDLRC